MTTTKMTKTRLLLCPLGWFLQLELLLDLGGHVRQAIHPYR